MTNGVRKMGITMDIIKVRTLNVIFLFILAMPQLKLYLTKEMLAELSPLVIPLIHLGFDVKFSF
jgi:hypothetical protein